MATPKETKFYIDLYSKNIWNLFSHELLAWIHWYLARNIVRNRRFNFCPWGHAWLPPMGT